MAPNGSLSSIDLNLIEELQDKEFRDAFFDEISRHETAEQIRELRLLRNKTQKELADICNMKQPAVSRLEKPDYGKWNFHTLVRLAEALDARVRIQLIPAERAIKEFERSEHDGIESLVTARQKALEHAQQKRPEGAFVVIAKASLHRVPKKKSSPIGLGSMNAQSRHLFSEAVK